MDVLRVRGLVRRERVALVLQSPREERIEDGREVPALFSQLVPDLAAAGLLMSRDDPVLLELPEPDRQPLRGHVREKSLEVAETSRPGEEVAHDEQRPPVADRVERARGETEVTVRGRHPLTQA